MATAAALLTLQAPLCALACLDTTETASATASNGGMPPCHDEGSDRAPADSPRSHEDCGCELASEALVVDSNAYSTVAATASIVAPSVFSPVVSPPIRWVPSIPNNTDLPPPDILLRKSTLII